MKTVKIDELQKGDLILVRWSDASEIRARINQHTNQPEIYVKDLGVFLGVSGVKRKHIIIGKDVVEHSTEWGAARIPLGLVDSVTLIMTRDEFIPAVSEVQALVRKIVVRKYKRVGLMICA